MRTNTSVTLLVTAAILGSAGFAFADKPGPQRGRPTVADVQRLMNKGLALRHLKDDRGSLIGPIQFGACVAAKAAEGQYEGCEDRCADWASQQPLTAADLANCGDDMSAAACADKIIDAKSKACIRMSGNPGCADEQANVIKARQACQECKSELVQLAALNKQKAAKEQEIARLQKQLTQATQDAQNIESQLAGLGKPCAPAGGKPGTGDPAKGKPGAGDPARGKPGMGDPAAPKK